MKLASLVGRGATEAEAKKHFAEQIVRMAQVASTPPAFAWDDDGAVIVALERPWGNARFRATDTHARQIARGPLHPEGPAAGLARADRYTPLPAYAPGAGDGQPRRTLFTLFTLAQIEHALSTAYDRSLGFTADPASLYLFREAVKALLINPRSEYPNPDDQADA
ncbi:hypothetical protein [Streptomyces sp. 4F14]|uniref:hypothetical protein n=1 Tax=Streptomyces sp. 4F14 TaxID=3394380 RepID=UPI003A878D95